MDDVLDIAEVVRRTGLTSRALRFYEARGLLAPLRTHNGRRLYGSAELERINQLVALKKAGLTLAQIGRVTERRPIDLARLVDAQLEALTVQATALANARTLLLTVKSRIDQGAPIDVATFCALIRNGEKLMEQDAWQAVTDRYFSPEARADWAAQTPVEFNSEQYNEQWRDLGGRIHAALPIDPGSTQAQAFVDEWFALLKPFRDIATPAMWEGSVRMFDDLDSWSGELDPGFGKPVWDLMKLATARRLLDGVQDLGGPQTPDDAHTPNRQTS